MQRAPRLPFFRLLVPRLSSPRPSLLPSHRPPTPSIRITSPTSRGFRQYAPLRQESPSPSSSDKDVELENPNASITQKLKTLIKSYGWYALGVYIIIGVVDFSISFAAINLLGAEQVSKVTNHIKHAVMDAFHGGSSADTSPDGMADREPATSGGEGLYAMIILAYTMHKTLFMPLRAGLTVGLTPRLVRWLRSRGWTGKGGATRAVTHAREKMKRNRD